MRTHDIASDKVARFARHLKIGVGVDEAALVADRLDALQISTLADGRDDEVCRQFKLGAFDRRRNALAVHFAFAHA